MHDQGSFLLIYSVPGNSVTVLLKADKNIRPQARHRAVNIKAIGSIVLTFQSHPDRFARLSERQPTLYLFSVGDIFG